MFLQKEPPSCSKSMLISPPFIPSFLPYSVLFSFLSVSFFLPFPSSLSLSFFSQSQSSPGGVEGVFPLGWVNFMAYGYEGLLHSGSFSLRLWPDQVFFCFFLFLSSSFSFSLFLLILFIQICKTTGTTCLNWDHSAPTLNFLIPSSPLPIVSFPPPPPPSSLSPLSLSSSSTSFALPPSRSASSVDRRRDGRKKRGAGESGRSRMSLLYSHRLEEVIILFIRSFIFVSVLLLISLLSRL